MVGLIGSDYDQLENPVSRDAELSEAQVEDMVRSAVTEARRKEEAGSSLHHGLSGYQYWIKATEAGEVADVHDLGDFIVLVIEARESAGQYLREIASHYSEAVAVHLREAGNEYDREVEYLVELGLLFPDRGVPKVDLEDPQARKKVSRVIQEVYTREKKAVESLEEVLAVISAAE